MACPLDEVLLLALFAVLAGAEGFTDIARFGVRKLAFLRRLRPFAQGTPSHDHPGDLFAALDAKAFQRCFVAWVASLTGAPPELIAIDGKTSRRSGRKGGHDALHLVSAFAARERLVLAQTKTSAKSNEITAIPALLDLLSLEGALVPIDAMGCQRAEAQKVPDKGGDYLLGIKGNQGASPYPRNPLFSLTDPSSPFHPPPVPASYRFWCHLTAIHGTAPAQDVRRRTRPDGPDAKKAARRPPLAALKCRHVLDLSRENPSRR